MDRKVGEVFDFDGHKLEVVKAKNVSCTGCFFLTTCRTGKDMVKVTGECADAYRDDATGVIFKEVKKMVKTYYYHKKICLCQICNGTGVEVYYKCHDTLQRDPHERVCTQCKGTGLVTVQGEKKLTIEPYVPAKPTTL